MGILIQYFLIWLHEKTKKIAKQTTFWKRTRKNSKNFREINSLVTSLEKTVDLTEKSQMHLMLVFLGIVQPKLQSNKLISRKIWFYFWILKLISREKNRIV